MREKEAPGMCEGNIRHHRHRLERFECEKCNPETEYRYKEGRKPRGKVKRNDNRRCAQNHPEETATEKSTTRGKMEQRKNRGTDYRGRGNMGYIPKEWIEEIRRYKAMGKRPGDPNTGTNKQKSPTCFTGTGRKLRIAYHFPTLHPGHCLTQIHA
jgi:hypothetical protein